MKDKTFIVIAHRLSTIKNMDRIIVLKDGEIVQDGSHRSLVIKEGIYKQLWTLPHSGFIVGESIKVCLNTVSLRRLPTLQRGSALHQK